MPETALTRRGQGIIALPFNVNPGSTQGKALADQLIRHLPNGLFQRFSHEIHLPFGHNQRRRHHIQMADRAHHQPQAFAQVRDALAFVGGSLFLALVKERYRAARILAGALTLGTALGWAFALFPYVVYPNITFVAAAAPSATLLAVLALLALGSIVLVPSLVVLIRVFKSSKAR